ncbi:MAG: type II secretion system protein [Elusimicrobia bacterium]|nr:type II secretion system protein [Elusimicrobiota bacterium]
MRSRATSKGRSFSQSGFTLAEIVVSVIILVPVMILILSVFMTSIRSVTDSWDVTKSTAVAQRLIDKIRSMRWDENLSSASSVLGPDSGESGPGDFDDVDDWNNFSLPDSLASSVRYGRHVDVDYVTLNASGQVVSSTAPTNCKRVTVRVTNVVGKVTVLSVLIVNT